MRGATTFLAASLLAALGPRLGRAQVTLLVNGAPPTVGTFAFPGTVNTVQIGNEYFVSSPTHGMVLSVCCSLRHADFNTDS